MTTSKPRAGFIRAVHLAPTITTQSQAATVAMSTSIAMPSIADSAHGVLRKRCSGGACPILVHW